MRTLNSEQIQILSTLIDERYEAEWIVDNLPVVIESRGQNQQGKPFILHSPFFPLGRASTQWADPSKRNVTQPMNMLFNHHKLTLYYERTRQARGLRIVGVVVQPWSIKHTKSFVDSANPHEFPLTCWEHLHHEPLLLNTSAPSMEVIWTYSVDWQPAPPGVTWANRWDNLVRWLRRAMSARRVCGNSNPLPLSQFREVDWESHWFGLVSSSAIMVPFSLIMMAVFFRTCRKTRSMNVEEEIEQSGWKVMRGD